MHSLLMWYHSMEADAFLRKQNTIKERHSTQRHKMWREHCTHKTKIVLSSTHGDIKWGLTQWDSRKKTVWIGTLWFASKNIWYYVKVSLDGKFHRGSFLQMTPKFRYNFSFSKFYIFGGKMHYYTQRLYKANEQYVKWKFSNKIFSLILCR